MEIKIKRGKRNIVAIVDKDMFPLLNMFSWHLEYSPSSEYLIANVPNGLIVPFRTSRRCTIEKKTKKKYFYRKAYMHWVVLSPPDGMVIDHINHNSFDNRRKNLRIVTKGDNIRNFKNYLQKNNTSGIRGVMFVKRDKLWRAAFKYNKHTFQKLFKLKEDAIKQRKEWESNYLIAV